MSDIYLAIEQLQHPQKSIGNILIDFYDKMKALETSEHRGGKQATLIVMAINDLESIITETEHIKLNDFTLGQQCSYYMNYCGKLKHYPATIIRINPLTINVNFPDGTNQELNPNINKISHV